MRNLKKNDLKAKNLKTPDLKAKNLTAQTLKACPICGGTMQYFAPEAVNICPYCYFKSLDEPLKEGRASHDIKVTPPKFFSKYIQNVESHYETTIQENLEPSYDIGLTNLKLITSDFMLPFQKDINSFFKARYASLERGGFLILSVPVEGIFFKAPPLTGQINILRSKNIMFLLERNGFKLVRRSMPFGWIVYLIAQKI